MNTAENLTAIDAASEGDRTWFEQHPTRRTRIRPFVPGELPSRFMPGDLVACVIVRQVHPGFRVRLPTQLPRLPPDTEGESAKIFQRMMERSA